MRSAKVASQGEQSPMTTLGAARIRLEAGSVELDPPRVSLHPRRVKVDVICVNFALFRGIRPALGMKFSVFMVNQRLPDLRADRRAVVLAPEPQRTPFVFRSSAQRFHTEITAKHGLR